METQRKCEVCNTYFTPKTVKSIYCSQRCSKVASKRKKVENEKKQRLENIVSDIPNDCDYISIPEALALFRVGRTTLYTLIRKGMIPSINMGQRLTRLSKSQLETLFGKREDLPKETVPKKKQYSLEPEDCYTIGEIAQKFNLGEKTVYSHIRKYSIPTRQIGRFVYVPKSEIDDLYKNTKR